MHEWLLGVMTLIQLLPSKTKGQRVWLTRPIPSFSYKETKTHSAKNQTKPNQTNDTNGEIENLPHFEEVLVLWTKKKST